MKHEQISQMLWSSIGTRLWNLRDLVDKSLAKELKNDLHYDLIYFFYALEEEIAAELDGSHEKA